MKYRRQEKSVSMPAGLALGLLAEVTVTCLLTAILSSLILQERIQEQSLGYGVLCILTAVPMLGGITACRFIKRRKLLVCALGGALYCGLLMVAAAILFRGKLQEILPCIAPIAGGSGVAAIWSQRNKPAKKRKRAQANLR